jgi:hypothetical protein
MPSCLRQAEGAHAVDQAEVDRLGARRSLPVTSSSGLAEDFGSGRAVDVGAMAERAQQARILGQMRHDPQLDLRIVAATILQPGGATKAVRMRRPLGADRDVLQVRIGGRQPPGRGPPGGSWCARARCAD